MVLVLKFAKPKILGWLAWTMTKPFQSTSGQSTQEFWLTYETWCLTFKIVDLLFQVQNFAFGSSSSSFSLKTKSMKWKQTILISNDPHFFTAKQSQMIGDSTDGNFEPWEMIILSKLDKPSKEMLPSSTEADIWIKLLVSLIYHLFK